jgi:hypothetical protein
MQNRIHFIVSNIAWLYRYSKVWKSLLELNIDIKQPAYVLTIIIHDELCSVYVCLLVGSFDCLLAYSLTSILLFLFLLW